jgi:HAD superfamily hydrolase (TIGR01490 family)
MVEAGVTGLAGLSVTHATQLAERCVDETIWAKVFTEALEAVARHRAEGDDVILASGSSRTIVETLARRVGAHDCVASEAMVDESGVFLPQAKAPLCYDVGKTRLVEEWAAKRGHKLADAVFYTDNHQDLTLLERVGRPVAVNPDEHLRPVAVARGWPIETWHRAVGGERTGSFGPLRAE